MTVRDVQDAGGRLSVGGYAGHACLLVFAVVGSAVFGWVEAGLSTYLKVVDPRGGADPGKAVDLTWAGLVVALLLTLLATPGLPRGDGSTQWWKGWGGFGGAIVQFGCGVFLIGGTLLGNVIFRPYTFGGPDTPCTYASCWPLRPQGLALTLPGIAAGTALIVMAVLVGRLRWWLRAFVPAATWLLLLLVQNTIWDPYLLPIFQGGPR